jgi:hypothetical protein
MIIIIPNMIITLLTPSCVKFDRASKLRNHPVLQVLPPLPPPPARREEPLPPAPPADSDDDAGAFG